MNKAEKYAIFKHVLAWLKQNGLPTSKIAMQKTLFFLQEKGIPLDLDFEPYSYGPFSREAMQTASELQRQGEIHVMRTKYEPADEFCDTLDPEKKHEITPHLEKFAEILEEDFSFDNLELYGTVLYSIQALRENALATDRDSVLKEFKAWKKNKFPDATVLKAYAALASDFIPNEGKR